MNISCDKPNTYGTIRPPPFFSAETTITIGVQAPTGINYTHLYLQWQKPRLQSMYKHLKIEVGMYGKL